MEPSYKKITQVINYLLRKDASSSSMPELKVIKLVWAADRYHLRKYARTVSGDQYYAMNNGPVGSMTKDIAEFSCQSTFQCLNDSAFQYLAAYIKYEKNNQNAQLSSVNEVDKNELSETDFEALDFAWDNFGKYAYNNLIEITHLYPEWAIHQDRLKNGQKRTRINLLDFFKNPQIDQTNRQYFPNNSDPFNVTDSYVSSSQQIFQEYA